MGAYVIGMPSAIVLLFIMNANFFISFVARVKAHIKVKQYSERDTLKWPFFTIIEGADAEGADAEARTEANTEASAADNLCFAFACVERGKAQKKRTGSLEEPLMGSFG